MNEKDILKELGVKILNDYPIYSRDIKTVGCINGFFIFPYSYYWVVKGKMPIKYANELYDYRNTLGIRVDGGSNENKPINFCTSDEFEEFSQELSKKVKLMGLDEFIETLKNKKNELKEECIDSFYVKMYHIDDLKGLKKVVDVIKENNIKTVWG